MKTVEKVLKVSDNLVVVFFADAPSISIATDDGTALKLAMSMLVDSFRNQVRRQAA